MAEKGSTFTADAGDEGAALAEALAPLGDVTTRRMFGGVGIFHDKQMFALVDSSGQSFLRVDDTNRSAFEEAGAERHGKMPYYAIPGDVRTDDDTLRAWAKDSIAAAGRAKK